MELLREVVAAVRGSWPEQAPLFVRISATDWVDGGWDIQQSVELARRLGADFIDCSSAGSVAQATIPVGPGYQTPFAERIQRETNILTGAVGMITSPFQAEHIIGTEQADAVIMARTSARAASLVACPVSQGGPGGLPASSCDRPQEA